MARSASFGVRHIQAHRTHQSMAAFTRKELLQSSCICLAVCSFIVLLPDHENYESHVAWVERLL